MSKLGLWKATVILAEQYKADPRMILINAVGLILSEATLSASIFESRVLFHLVLPRMGQIGLDWIKRHQDLL